MSALVKLFHFFCLSCNWEDTLKTPDTLWTNRALCPKCDGYTDAIEA